MTKISLLHPSRSRPEKAKATARKWIEQAGVEVEHIFSVDNSDPKKLEYLDTGWTTMVYPNESVVEATNRAAAASTGDILVYCSDDFMPFDNWGPVIIKQFEGENRPLLLKVNDGLQQFHVPVLTIPIMNRALYEKLGYFWHPAYKSMHVDVDLYWTVFKLGALKMAQQITFEHQHPANGKAADDDTYRRSAANWNQGLEVFNRRKAEGFPI